MPYAIPTMLFASAEQIGAAARMRDLVHDEDRQQLNYVVHSPHPDSNFGHNPYASHSGYDPVVTTLLRDVAQRHSLPTGDIVLVELLHDIKVWVRKLGDAKARAAWEAVSVK
jgi:hypothetical protein